MSVLLDVKDLSVAYRGGALALDALSVRVEAGTFVSVVGESGSGKTTFVNAVLGLLPTGAQITGGQVTLGDKSHAVLGRGGLARARGSFVGYIPQDPGAALNPVKRVGNQVADAIRAHRRLPAEKLRELVLSKLTEAGLGNVERVSRAFPFELSGGMKQRVLIAIALANDPHLLVADEPTSALDVTIQKTILDHLSGLRATRDLGVLLVTHDLGVAAERSDVIYVMRSGSVVETGPAGAMIERPQTEYTTQLLRAAPTIDSPRLSPQGIAGAVPVGGEPVVEVVGVGHTFASRDRLPGVVALKGVDLVVRRGTTHAVVGESGAGKSTLARIILGLVRPQTGQVRVLGSAVPERRDRAWRLARRNLQFVHQNPYLSLDPRLRVLDVVSEPLDHFGLVERAGDRVHRAEELLRAVRLDPVFLARRPSELSGGERQRVAIARALALQPEVIIFDEAVSALDVLVQAAILELITELQSQYGLSYLLITHDLGVVAQVADDVTVLRDGEVVEAGSAAQVLRAPVHPYTKRFIEATPERAASRRPHVGSQK